MLLEDTKRLEKIDQLYTLRLDQLVSLPVLVVVGDQSSGKSSVLEALTGLPLPRDAGLCTRFATQILFKRSEQEHIEITIIPAASTQSREREDLSKFTRRHNNNISAFDETSLMNVLNTAAHLMGVPGVGQSCSEGMTSFSNDLLKIEMSGPKYEHFSVVDLPGLFRKPTPGQTTKEDMALVHQMVSRYLNNPRSIILAVVPANVDIATQEIVQMAEDADPLRKRTLGVLTKPDLIDRGAESKIVELLMNDNGAPGLGYIALCNRSQSNLDVSLTQRHIHEENFFNNATWQQVPKQQLGVAALQRRLNNLLVDVTRLSFDDVMTDIDQKSLAIRKQLEHLGAPRRTSEAQRLFMLQMASRFQTLIGKATDAYYGRDECFRTHAELCLATVIMGANEKFSATMSKHGIQHPSTASDSPDSESDGDVSTLDLVGADSDKGREVRDDMSDFQELRALFGSRGTEPVKSDEPVEAWITRLYHDFRGFEVGLTNFSLISTLISEQISGWAYYAHCHVSDTIIKIHRCVHTLLTYVCPDLDVRSRLWTRLLPGLCATYQRAVEHTNFLLTTESKGYPITMNHYFTTTLKKRRMARIEKRLRSMKSWHTSDAAREPLLRLDDTLKAYVSNEQHNIEDLNDILRSYLKVARKRFVDNVCKQVVDHHLVCSPHGPLYIFSPEFVGRLETANLEQLAGESHDTAALRQRLQLEMDTLVRGKQILQG